MSKKDYRIVVADMPDMENPIAEVHYKNEYWAEVSAETPNELLNDSTWKETRHPLIVLN
jgi:hypothetical protein